MSPSSDSTLHPLHVSPFLESSSHFNASTSSPVLDSTPFASTSSHEHPTSTSSSRVPSPSLRSVTAVNRRLKPAAPPSDLIGTFSSSSSRRNSPARVPINLIDNDDADVTRPGLRRATKDALGSIDSGPTTSAKDVKGKGKASANDQDREREVVVHTVLKTDTIASVSLQYGITQQALRKANRLWPTDPVHLRPTLHIPLEECNLPSSSFGLERIAREENGDITVWRREASNDHSSSNGLASSLASEGAGLARAAGRIEKEHSILSPQARRIIAASTYEAPGPPSTASDFLAIWEDESLPSASNRVSLESTRTGSTSSPSNRSSFSPYLAPTTHSYTSSPPLIHTDLSSTSVIANPLTPDYLSSPPSHFRSVSSTSSTSPSRVASVAGSDTTSPPSESGGGGGTLSKRTLKIERLPASKLSFFPPASGSSGTSSPSRSREPSHQSSSSSTLNRSNGGGGIEESTDLFFGPLTNSLSTSFSSLGLDKYLPTSLSSTTTTTSPRHSRKPSKPIRPSNSTPSLRLSSPPFNTTSHRTSSSSRQGPIALPRDRSVSPLPSSSSPSSQRTITRSNSFATIRGNGYRDDTTNGGTYQPHENGTSNSDSWLRRGRLVAGNGTTSNGNGNGGSSGGFFGETLLELGSLASTAAANVGKKSRWNLDWFGGEEQDEYDRMQRRKGREAGRGRVAGDRKTREGERIRDGGVSQADRGIERYRDEEEEGGAREDEGRQRRDGLIAMEHVG